jgi:hypothetical protein
MPGAPIMLFDATKAESGATVETTPTGTLKLQRAPEPDYSQMQDEPG